MLEYFYGSILKKSIMIDSRAFFSQKKAQFISRKCKMHLETSKDCCYETQKSKSAYIGTFFASQLFYTTQAAPPKKINNHPIS